MTGPGWLAAALAALMLLIAASCAARLAIPGFAAPYRA